MDEELAETEGVIVGSSGIEEVIDMEVVSTAAAVPDSDSVMVAAEEDDRTLAEAESVGIGVALLSLMTSSTII